MSNPDNHNQWDDLLADLGLPGEPSPEKPAPAPEPSEPVAEAFESEPVEPAPRRGRKRATPVEASAETEMATEAEPTREMESEDAGEEAGTENAEEPETEADPKRRRRRGRRKKKTTSAEEIASEEIASEETVMAATVQESTDPELDPTEENHHSIVEPAPMLVEEPDEEAEEGEAEQGLEDPLEFGQEENEGDKKRRRRRRRKKKGAGAQTASTPTVAPTQKMAAAPHTIIEPRDLDRSFDMEDETDLDEDFSPTSPGEDDEDDEIIDMSNWNIISWQDLIAGLYRPG